MNELFILSIETPKQDNRKIFWNYFFLQWASHLRNFFPFIWKFLFKNLYSFFFFSSRQYPPQASLRTLSLIYYYFVVEWRGNGWYLTTWKLFHVRTIHVKISYPMYSSLNIQQKKKKFESYQLVKMKRSESCTRNFGQCWFGQ